MDKFIDIIEWFIWFIVGMTLLVSITVSADQFIVWEERITVFLVVIGLIRLYRIEKYMRRHE